MALDDREDGLTVFGSNRVKSCAIAANAKAGSASGFAFVQPNGTEKYIWVNDSGELQIGTRAQFVAMTGSTKVGGQ